MLFLCNLCRPASRYLHGYGVTSIKREPGVHSVLSGKCCCVLLVLPIDEKFHYFKSIQKIRYRLALSFYHFTSSKGTTFLRRLLKPVGLVWNLRLLSPASAAGAFRVKSNESGFTRISGRRIMLLLSAFHTTYQELTEKGIQMSSSTCGPAPAPCFCLLSPACAVLTQVSYYLKRLPG